MKEEALPRRTRLLSTLRETVKAMGGEVRIVAEFPDRRPVVLSDLSSSGQVRRSNRRGRRAEK